MIRWLLYLPFTIITSLLSYILNPFVVLFCDKNGELPGFLSYFQTWDDSCNPRCACVEMAPKIIRFDWDRHFTEYLGHTPELDAVGRTRWFSECIDDDFTFSEKIRLYLCRLYWLTRNCGYGFSFWWFGIDYDTNKVVYTQNDEYVTKLYVGEGSSLFRPWSYQNSTPFKIFGIKCEWNIYLGWKIYITGQGRARAMIAIRPCFKIP